MAICNAFFRDGSVFVAGLFAGGVLGVFNYACAVLLAALMIYAKFARKELRVEWHDGHDVDESALKKAVEDAGFEFGGRV